MDNDNDPVFSEIENEPTPYGLGDGSPSPRKRGTENDAVALKKRNIAIFASAGAVLIISIAVGIFITHDKPAPRIASTPPGVASPTSTQAPAANPTSSLPSITISGEKTNAGYELFIQWSDLPNGTVKINIYHSATKNGPYTFVGSIIINSASGNGSGSLDLPSGDAGGYYYGVASGDGGSPLWTSSSTPPSTGSGDNGGGNSPPENNGGNNSSSSNSGNGSGDTGNGNGGGAGGSGGGNSTSTGPAENFLVEHDDQKIQISWQSLPANTYEIVVARSASDTDPWTPVLTETNISTDGPYSIQIVDDTLGDPYYYEMDAEDVSGNIITTYGPTLLEPL